MSKEPQIDPKVCSAQGKLTVFNDQPTAPGDNTRKMCCTELSGSHLHETSVGTNVAIWRRGETFLARGRFQRRTFGVTLGSNELAAKGELRRLLTAIEDGTFIRPSEARKRPLKCTQVPVYDLRQLCSEFLTEKRSHRGKKTAQDYQSRLAPILDFAERQENKVRWPLARDLDRQFVLELRTFLVNRTVTRNGRPGATPKMMSPRQVVNCLETLRSVIAWALMASVRKLPPEFVNPCTRELIGNPPAKDPLRKVVLTTDRRVDLVGMMDVWQLCNLTLLLVLPLRFEDLARALISDVSLSEQTLQVGSKFGGSDFSKCKVNFVLPLPDQMLPVLRQAIDGRPEGPLFRGRRSLDDPHRHGISVPQNRSDVEQIFGELLAAQKPGSILTDHDRKQVFRELMRKLGGITEDVIGKEMKELFARIGLGLGIRPYDLRGAVTTDLKNAGINHLELRYLTGHSANDILNEYTGVDPQREIQKHFRSIRPLLDAIEKRFGDLGLATARESGSCRPVSTGVESGRSTDVEM